MTPQQTKILIAADHAGVGMKTALQKLLPDWEWIDLGPWDETKVDYPDYAEALCKKIREGIASQGILICGSGIGMSISANKVQGIRAALVDNALAARLSREHNNANVLCLGSRFLAPEYAATIAEAWLSAGFSGEPRHEARVKKINQLEKENP